MEAEVPLFFFSLFRDSCKVILDKKTSIAST
jgi:hypothetical protein